MNRPKRDVKAPQRLIEDDEPKAKKAAKQTLNLDVGNDRPVESVDEVIKNTILKPPKNAKRVINVKLEEAQPVDVDKIIKETKATKTTKTSKPPTRTLNLDLSDVPPSGDIKFSKDWGLYNNPFWAKFYTPDDNFTI